MGEVIDCTFINQSRWSAVWNAIRGRKATVTLGAESTIKGCTFHGCEVRDSTPGAMG